MQEKLKEARYRIASSLGSFCTGPLHGIRNSDKWHGTVISAYILLSPGGEKVAGVRGWWVGTEAFYVIHHNWNKGGGVKNIGCCESSRQEKNEEMASEIVEKLLCTTVCISLTTCSKNVGHVSSGVSWVHIPCCLIYQVTMVMTAW